MKNALGAKEGEGADEGEGDESPKNKFDHEIRELKKKIKEIEERLKGLRSSKASGSFRPPIAPSDEKGSDYTNFIYDLNDRLEVLEGAHEKTVEKVNDHNDRIEKLEGDNETNKEKIASNSNDIGELKDTISDKVD